MKGPWMRPSLVIQTKGRHAHKSPGTVKTVLYFKRDLEYITGMVAECKERVREQMETECG